MQITTIGLDLAKHLVSSPRDRRRRKARRQATGLRRSEVVEFFKGLEPCLVGMEACARRTIGRES